MRMDEAGFAERIEQERQARQEACKILEVDENADKQTLKKAYRRACLKYHPDRNPTDQKSHKKILLVQCAYRLLAENTTCKMLLEERTSAFSSLPNSKYNLDNTWGYFLWWRERFPDEL